MLVSIKLKLFYLSRNKVSVDESVDGKYKSALNNQIRSVHKHVIVQWLEQSFVERLIWVRISLMCGASLMLPLCRGIAGRL